MTRFAFGRTAHAGRAAAELVAAMPRMLALLALLALLATGCEPCFGVVGCSKGSYLAATGQIVDAISGAGIDGVRIDVVRTGGIAVDQDSVTDITNDGGFWRVELGTDATGVVEADIQVTPPNARPYRLHGVRLATKEHRGDANLNERWVPFLYFRYVGEFFLEGTADQRVAGAKVEFRRTGGIALAGPGIVGDVFRTVSDVVGRVPLFPTEGDAAVFALEDGELVGDLIFYMPGTADSMVTRGARLTPVHSYRDRAQFPPVIRLPVGP